MYKSKLKDADTLRRDLRAMFLKWAIGNYSIDRDREEYTSGVAKRGNGVKVSFLRKSGWNTVYANKSDFTTNLRNIFNFLDRIRIAEKEGVAYQSLSSTTDLTKTDQPDSNQEEAANLEDAYDVLGADPSDTIETIDRVYRAKAQAYHPDSANGDEAKMKRLNAAHDLILKSRPPKK